MSPTKKIRVGETEIAVLLLPDQNDYICLTDMARFKDNDPADIIAHWMRNRNTLEYLGLWETLHNPDFKPTEFEGFRSEAGLHSFTMSRILKWSNLTTLEKRLAYLRSLALFGCTAKDWEEANPTLAGKMNVRDTASINQLVVLANMESYNSEMIKQGIPRGERFNTLRRMAEEQMHLLDRSNAEQNFRKLESDGDSKRGGSMN